MRRRLGPGSAAEDPPTQKISDGALDSIPLGPLALALGAPELGLDGWRHSHRQARAALRLALHRPGVATHYASDPLLAAIVQDEFTSQTLLNLFLGPLERRDDGLELKRTLRAYFIAGRNGASAAAALKVSRQTVANRLQMVEERLGRNLADCGTELDLALRLDELMIPSPA